MENDFDALCRLLDDVVAANVPFDEVNVIEKAGQILPLAGREIVENPDGVTLPDQFFDEMGADETGTARYKKSHVGVCFLFRFDLRRKRSNVLASPPRRWCVVERL